MEWRVYDGWSKGLSGRIIMRKIWSIVLILICIFALVVTGCSSSEERTVDLPESNAIERIELQYIEGCTLSNAKEVSDEDWINIYKEITTVGGSKTESVNDVPQEDPYVILSIYTKEHKDDKDIYVYGKNGYYYMEQPYVGVWKITKEFYMFLNDYDGEIVGCLGGGVKG